MKEVISCLKSSFSSYFHLYCLLMIRSKCPLNHSNSKHQHLSNSPLPKDKYLLSKDSSRQCPQNNRHYLLKCSNKDKRLHHSCSSAL